MAKILLRIFSVLLILHGAATFAAANFLPLSVIGDRLLFAQHGFAFIFMALLNLVTWQSGLRGSFLRWSVHISNLGFLLFYVALCVRNPETPNCISAALVGVLFLLGLALDRAARVTSELPAA